MKKLFLYIIALLSVAGFNSCTDKDSANDPNGQMFRTMFRQNDNTGKGDNDPYNCVIVDRNTAHLYWYTVDDCYGYEIKWAVQNYVANGKVAWEETEAGLDGRSLSGKMVIPDPKQYDVEIPNLNYQTDYRFAIRVLHSSDPNDPQNSEWYGYGDGRQWAEYLGLQTAARYEVPSILQISDITKTSMRINLNRSAKGYTDEQMQGFKEHFKVIEEGQGEEKVTYFKVDYLTITPNAASPSATVPAGFDKYKITDADWARGYIDVQGFSENSVYNIDVWDESIQVKVDANYNAMMKRTKGDPGPPILVKHEVTSIDTIGDNTYDISEYKSMKLDNIFKAYLESMTLAENQVFYLEGGKAYHFTSNPNLYKGVTFRTNPEDVAKGLRATLYLSGMTKTGTTVNTSNFMLGRQPQSGENSSIAIDIDSIRFCDLDINVPLATNYGHQTEQLGNASGNYFMNMYSNGMGINVTLLEWDNCTFQGLIRGFMRVQGSNDFNVHNMKLTNCKFYNCGYYATTGGDYCYIYSDCNGKPKSTLLENLEIANNVFYDCPKGPLVTDANRNVVWASDNIWHINIHHNTFVNWSTRGNQPIVNLRYPAGGSEITFKDNLLILTKDAKDVNRTLNFQGCDIRTIQGGDGSGFVTFDIQNNWSTNDNLTAGQIFSAGAFSASSNAPGKFVKNGSATNIAGAEELDVHVDDISAVDLMVSPNPENMIGASANHLDHHTSKGINGLYYQQTDKVLNSNIYKKNVGAAFLRNGAPASAKARAFAARMFGK